MDAKNMGYSVVFLKMHFIDFIKTMGLESRHRSRYIRTTTLFPNPGLMRIVGVNYPKIAQHFRSVNDYKSPRFYNIIYIYTHYIMYTHIFYYLKNMGYFTFTYQPQAVHLRHWVFTCFYPRVCWDGASHAHEALERNFGGLKKRNPGMVGGGKSFVRHAQSRFVPKIALLSRKT